MRLRSYGKINLGLRVLGRRPDGYHEIETLLQTIDLYDEIELRPIPRAIRVHCAHPLVPEDRTNLAYRSAHLLKETYKVREGARITIKKEIPVGAGLGGGSSDGAVVLQGLAELWGLSLSARELFSAAAQIGSDVPFFLKGGTALATGRGQNLKYLSLPWGEIGFVVVYPRQVISSAWAYKSAKISLTQSRKYFNLKSLFRKGTFELSDLKTLVTNDLEKGVASKYPVIERAKEALLGEGASAAAMTGSGSAVYGLFLAWEGARKAAHRMCRPEWDVFLTKPINPAEEE
ncbi:MAG: 4-(cytidine 5'-diphospho)-2-C-methyl-D-erythritol kinase [bacterium]